MTDLKKLEKKDTKSSKGYSLTDDSRGLSSIKPDAAVTQTIKDESKFKTPSEDQEYYFSDEEIKTEIVKPNTNGINTSLSVTNLPEANTAAKELAKRDEQ